MQVTTTKIKNLSLSVSESFSGQKVDGLPLDQTFLHQKTLSNLVFIDPSVPDHKLLNEGLLSGHQAFMLSADQNGMEEIMRVFCDLIGVQNLNIVPHSNSGKPYLGSVQFDWENIHQYRDQLKSWASKLATNAQVLLYG